MDVVSWLLDSDPAIRWQVLRDLAGAGPAEVAAERDRVATEGWGARLLAMQGDDGQWAGGACFPGGFNWADLRFGQPWTSTLPVLELLWKSGVNPAAPVVQRTIAAVKAGCRWEHAGQPFFDGEVEPCINARVMAMAAYFGEDGRPILERLLGEQLEDGGWNCEAENGSVRSSFHTTINVLEGLLQFERVEGPTESTTAARERGEAYLLERHLFRRKSTGEVAEPAWLRFSFPVRWHYDVLRGLDYFRDANRRDPRLEEAIELVRGRRQADGTWLLENTHPGAVPFALEPGDGQPSRWNTLRALRVLAWWDGSPG
ncbi:MAG TPA: hypothetical protein PKI89_00440 [Tepidiformaceae bacterium]|nr:hypothetical protein [Tepidiformaceae bacterium]